MKKLKWISIILFAFFMTTMIGCGYTRVPAGYEGVKINTMGEGKGSLINVGVGRYFYSWKWEMEKFPTFKQNYVWTADKEEGSPANEQVTFQSKESLTFHANVGISYSVNKGYSAELYAMYRKGIEDITNVDMRNSVRDAFNRLGSLRSVEEIYGEGKSAFVKAVHADVTKYWEPHITIHKVYLVGEMAPPGEVKKSISAKIKATQMAQQRRNEVEQTEAEADKKIAKARGIKQSDILIAEGKAKSIELIEEQLRKSPMYIEYIKAERWDGVLPQFVGGGTIPMINLNPEPKPKG